MKRFSLLALLLLASPLRGADDLDPEASTPYQLKVVLCMAEHRLLTPVFKDQVSRELRDGLQAALGDMAKVEILDDFDKPEQADKPAKKKHGLVDDIKVKGLQEALDRWRSDEKKQAKLEREFGDTKTHFVVVDFNNDHYEIQARQYDGMTGFAGPLVRVTKTTDRQFVARAAALLVDQDFGVVGTVDPKSKINDLRITLKGGRLGSMKRWVKKGDVFAVSKISQVGGEMRGTRAPWTLLQTLDDPNDQGVCKCKLFHRYEDPLASAATVGYRCIRLGTTEGPLRLRLVDDKGLPRSGIEVRICQSGFSEGEETKTSTDADGFVENKTAKFRNLACVRLMSGGTQLAQIPVEIMQEHTIVCPVNPNAQAELLGQVTQKRNWWLKELYTSITIASKRTRDLNKLVDEKKYEEALDRSRLAVRELEGDIHNADNELVNLRAVVKDRKLRLDLADGEQRIKDMTTRRDQLKSFVENLENVIREKNDPKRAALLATLEKAKLKESEAEFDEAIDLYRQFLKEVPDNKDVKKHLDELEAAWALKGDAHRAARVFIYDKWRRFESVRELNDNFDQVVKAFEACKNVGDKRSPLMILKASVAHAAKLGERKDALQLDREDDRREAEMIGDIAKKLGEFITEVGNFVQTPSKPK